MNVEEPNHGVARVFIPEYAGALRADGLRCSPEEDSGWMRADPTDAAKGACRVARRVET